MASYAFDRLSPEENRFLLLEGPNTPMHVTMVSILRTGPLATESGGVDIRRYKAHVESLLHRLPRYRRKLKRVPLEGSPVWVDDAHFNLDYHVRHVALPRPGSIEELEKKAARIMVQPLDPRRPLWETWVVEHLAGGHFAIISKLHHCMLEAGDAMDLAQLSMSPSSEWEIPEARAYRPRPEPSGRELLAGEWSRRLSLPSHLIERVRELRDESESLFDETSARVRALASWLGATQTGVEATPLNGAVGPHRRLEWVSMSLAELKELRKSLSCTLNDVILLAVTGAVRRFLLQRHTDPADIPFRVSIPLSVHTDGDAGEAASDVRPWMIELPIGEPDPMEQLEALRTETASLKESFQALAADVISGVAEWTPSSLFARGARALARPLPVHLTITNVPGPQRPLFLLGAEQVEWYGAFPLMEHTGLGISTVSYDGRMCWCFCADRDLLPDLGSFVENVAAAFQELASLSGVGVVGFARPLASDAGESERRPST